MKIIFYQKIEEQSENRLEIVIGKLEITKWSQQRATNE